MMKKSINTNAYGLSIWAKPEKMAARRFTAPILVQTAPGIGFGRGAHSPRFRVLDAGHEAKTSAKKAVHLMAQTGQMSVKPGQGGQSLPLV